MEPDITVVCDPSKLDDIGYMGAPNLVMEILSPSTQRHDKLTKFNLYQRAEIIPARWFYCLKTSSLFRPRLAASRVLSQSFTMGISHTQLFVATMTNST